ncbi:MULTISPECIES: sterol desaturase family protein [Sphingomonadales]|jgi:sterol desaturase/sphingolipid hydroxylase (fatty acid hydroxylase superfamily)|uniref:sterol desaturase family protein n=1 Tax=Sphingomonadales TaxID=204457 RepID=UPI000826E9B5|nr:MULTISPECIES: sterol desaturase family protein [Sphingomonadales]MAF63639.1 sterol desaturase family protein [Blastomonas sp.]|tara:strand:+ start:13460 stop:14344 length:885 start_codon:yes stop_codon:yes gene_type:complete
MSLFRTLYAPVYFLGFVGAAAVLVSSGGSPIWLIALFALAIVTSLVSERVAPFEPVWNRSHGDARRDIAHALVNEGSILVLVLLLPFFASLVPWSSLWPSLLPFWAELALAIILLDAGISLTHYASHRIPLLWRFHAVHHSVRRMYGFNCLLKHPIHQLIEISVGTLPWLLLGIPQDVAIVGSFAVAIQLQLQHSNVDMRVGPLALLWAIAPVHRHHHLASETEGDVNFGLFLTIWDVMLGTAQFRSSAQIRASSLGIAGRSDYPETYLAQLVEPFTAELAATDPAPQRSGVRR